MASLLLVLLHMKFEAKERNQDCKAMNPLLPLRPTKEGSRFSLRKTHQQIEPLPAWRSDWPRTRLSKALQRRLGN